MFGLFGSKKKCKECRNELAKDAGVDGLCATCAAQSVSAAFADKGSISNFENETQRELLTHKNSDHFFREKKK